MQRKQRELELQSWRKERKSGEEKARYGQPSVFHEIEKTEQVKGWC